MASGVNYRPAMVTVSDPFWPDSSRGMLFCYALAIFNVGQLSYLVSQVFFR